MSSPRGRQARSSPRPSVAISGEVDPHLRAEADIDAIAAYVSARHPEAAARVESELQAAFALLATHPLAGRAIRRGVRRLTLPRYPYLIFYDVDEAAEDVRILSVRHAARRKLY